jgi:hypothetical protein
VPAPTVCPAGVRGPGSGVRGRWHGVQGRAASARRIFSRRLVGLLPLVWVASRPERNTRTDISPADVWSAGVREQGREPSEDIEVTIVRPAERIAGRLGLGEGETAVVRRRGRRVDGEIMLLADSYYPERLVRGTAIAQPG